MEEKAPLDTVVLAVLEVLQLHIHSLQVLTVAQGKVFYHKPQALKVVLGMLAYRSRVRRVVPVKAVCRSLGLKDFYRNPQVLGHRTDQDDLAVDSHCRIQVVVDLGLVSIPPPLCLHRHQLPSLPLVCLPVHSHLFQVRSQGPLCHILGAAQNLPCPCPENLENSLSRQNIDASSLVVLIGLSLSRLAALGRRHSTVVMDYHIHL